MRVAVVLFTRDLRVHDHPALAEAAARAETVVPLFVLDDRIAAGPSRRRFLLESLAGLRRSLGGKLVVRRGDPVGETMRIAEESGAEAVFLSADVSAYAQERERRLREERIEVRALPGITVVPPGELLPAAADHFRVFTPYWRRWSDAELRSVRRAPGALSVPGGIAPGRLPSPGRAPGPPGGEQAGRERLAAWLRSGLGRYGELHDDLAADGTSRLSPYLHFGCLSPREVVERAAGRDGAEPFLRQLAWRDFFHQLLAARPDASRADYRLRRRGWNDDPGALAAWKQGRTGIPLVDAGMRQLAAEGWMHNRARLVVASFLTKHLSVDWRLGAEHFLELLVDGDVAQNSGNWQWTAGTGADTRPNRILSPVRQARRYDPDGAYVRRWVEELAGVSGPALFEPWRHRGAKGYPPPLVDPAESASAWRRSSAQ